MLRFSNGLVAYLSGDTGITADQERVVRDYYHAKLAVMNIGDGFTTGPAEAAYVINELVKPASVIASHANEVGTVGGKVRPGSKTEAFIKAAQGAGARAAVGQDDGVRRRAASARRAAELSRVRAARSAAQASSALSLAALNGTLRRRTPVASKTALASAAGTGQAAASPAPSGGSVGAVDQVDLEPRHVRKAQDRIARPVAARDAARDRT